MNLGNRHTTLLPASPCWTAENATIPAVERLVQLTSKLLGAPMVVVAQIQENNLVFRQACGLDQQSIANPDLLLVQLLCRHIIEHRIPLIASDLKRITWLPPEFTHSSRPTRPVLGLPLQSTDGRVKGALCVVDVHAREWLPGEFGLLSELAQAIIGELEYQGQRSGCAQQLQKFKFVFTNWPQPALFTDTAGRITHWNEQAAAVFGWPAAQAVNQDWAELLFAGEAQSKFQALCQAMLSSSARRQIQLLTRCGTGREKACDWTLLPCLGGDGQLEGFFACATPIATPFVAALNA